MTNNEIKKYIDDLNTIGKSSLFFCRSLSDSVEISKIWGKEPALSDELYDKISHDYFFIKERKKYVGAILVTPSNLYWYILKEERKEGHLTKALKTTVLPYLFADYYEFNRLEQRITIARDKYYYDSRKVAEAVGFKVTNDNQTEFILKKKDFIWEEDDVEIQEDFKEHSFDETIQIKKRIVFIARKLQRLKDELLINMGDTHGIDKISDDLINISKKFVLNEE